MSAPWRPQPAGEREVVAGVGDTVGIMRVMQHREHVVEQASTAEAGELTASILPT